MIAHGVTFVGWMLQWEPLAPADDQVGLWNEAVDRSQTAETKVVETTYRMLRVHPDDEVCPMCPVPKPQPEAELPVPGDAPKESGTGHAPAEQPPIILAGPLKDEPPAE